MHSPKNQKRTNYLTIQINFIGYDDKILGTSVFHELGGLNDFYPDIETIGEYDVTIETNLITIDDIYYEEFLTYAETIANFSAVTSELNITLLEEDSIDPHDGIKSDVFYEREGVSLNATLVQNYLDDYPPAEILDPWTYVLNFLNLSILDTGTTEHWYDISEIDLDTGNTFSDWFSEYSGLVDRPVAGWSGENSRTYFFDPSALEAMWYFDWIITDYFWQFLDYTNPFVYTDLEDYIEAHETFQPADLSLEEYLYNFTYDIMYNDLLVRPYAVLTPNDSNLFFEIAIVENFTRGAIHTLEDLEFIINQNTIVEAFEDLLPFFNVQANIHWYSLDDYPEIQELFDTATTQYDDYYQIEVTEGSPQTLLEYFSDNLGQFVDIHPDGINFPTMAFLMNRSRMSYDGTRFGGLGGMGWQLIAYQWDRFMDTSVVPPIPKTGISDVIIHEAGHTLGFNHPHHSNYWVGDFVDSVMSYYTVNSYFNQFEKDWIQSLLVQQLLFGLINEYETMGQSYSLTSPEAVKKINQDTVEKLTQAWISFKRMDFPAAFSQAREAAIIVETLASTLNQVGISETNPSFILPEPTLEETTEISTTPTNPSTEIKTSIIPTSQTTEATPLPIIGIIIALPILLISGKKRKKGSL